MYLIISQTICRFIQLLLLKCYGLLQSFFYILAIMYDDNTSQTLLGAKSFRSSRKHVIYKHIEYILYVYDCGL